MVFSSISFLILFLPLIVGLYYVNRNPHWRNGVLLLASLFFYALGEPVYIFLLLFMAAANFLLSNYLRVVSRPKLLLALIVIMDVGILSLFKIAPTFAQLTGCNAGVFSVLPIGISFYTFQILSYCIDVYRKPERAQASFLRFLLYVSFFPQLIAGPIVRYHDVSEMLDDRSVCLGEFMLGLRRFIFGLGKKVIIANTAGKIVDMVYGYTKYEISPAMAFAGALLYCLQIYYDFSGYSDMAIGLGEMFGFHFLENFKHPYGATNMKEFWRRWHISLSGWFKEYLYIPMGGNRKGRARTLLHKYIVFTCTGLWHGVSLNFLIWGLIHGSFTVLEEFGSWAKRLTGQGKHGLARGFWMILGWLYQMTVVCLAFVFFRAETFAQSMEMLAAMGSGILGAFCGRGWAAFMVNASAASGLAAGQNFLAAFDHQTLAILLFAVIAMFDWQSILQEKIEKRRGFYRVLSCIASLLVLLWSIASLAAGSYNPFIYYRF